MINRLILGDNLEVLKNINSESVDLIYLDPPFFSNRTYEVIWGDAGEIRSFDDRFSGGIDHYIAWLKDRVIELHRILRPTGSIFLHCDWHANAEIKIFILNKVFGANNFRGEIIWKRHNSHNDAKKKIAVITDTIWYYSKSDEYVYNPIYGALSEEYKKDFFKFDDNDGKGLYRLGDMTSPNPRSNMMYEYKGFSFPAKGWRYERATMEKLDAEGKIYFPKDKKGNLDYSKRLALKRYLNEREAQGQLLANVWDDIQNVQGAAKERIGYPTQKPMALLQRIIEMASNEGDIVLDPFVGGGTTVAVADKLNRAWIGIDQSVQAVKVTEFRMNAQQDLFSKPFMVQLQKYDYDTLRYKDAFEFETWIVQQFGGYANNKQRGDLGLDGRTTSNTPIQVKRSDAIGRNVIDNFLSAVQRYDKAVFERNKAEQRPVGYVIAFSFGKGAIQEVARLRNEEGVIIELKKVEDIVPIAKKPILKVSVNDWGTNKEWREIQFVAIGESENGIEFYAWDFDYKNNRFNPTILLDKSGTQTHKFKAGTHQIAAKVVDNEGLESIEIIKLKINGVIVIND